jgi:hypothetical protein
MKCGQRFSSDARLIAHDCQPGTYSPNLSPSKSHAQHTGSHGYVLLLLLQFANIFIH